eukprot:1142431-Pelagomonas_calceolata.AAC.11
MQIRWLSGRWSAGGLQSFRTGPPSGPGPSKGTCKSMLVMFVLTGAVPGAWLGAIGQLLSDAEHYNVSCSSA